MADEFFGLSRKAYEQVKQVIRQVLRTTKSPPQYRRGGLTGGSLTSAETRYAYCKTSAGSGNTIQAYLDTDLTGEEITVHCTILPSTTTALNLALPRLSTGTPISVGYDSQNEIWRCNWGFYGSGPC